MKDNAAVLGVTAIHAVAQSIIGRLLANFVGKAVELALANNSVLVVADDDDNN